MNAATSHRWTLIGAQQQKPARQSSHAAPTRFHWQCIRCTAKAITAPTPYVRSQIGTIVNGTRLDRGDRIPPCRDGPPPPDYPSRHAWTVRANRSGDRAHWTCKRCGLEAETTISVLHPSADHGQPFMRAPGSIWERLRGRIPACPGARAMQP